MPQPDAADSADDQTRGARGDVSDELLSDNEGSFDNGHNSYMSENEDANDFATSEAWSSAAQGQEDLRRRRLTRASSAQDPRTVEVALES
jgi:hypothetical protein